MPYNPLDPLNTRSQIDARALRQVAEQAALAGGAMAGGGLCYYQSDQGLIYVPVSDPVLSSTTVDTLTISGGPAVQAGPGPGNPASGLIFTPTGSVTPPGGSPGPGLVFPLSFPIHIGDPGNPGARIGKSTQGGNPGVGIVATTPITPTGGSPGPGVSIPGGFPVHVGDPANPALSFSTGTKDGSPGTLLMATGPITPAGGSPGAGLVIPGGFPVFVGDVSMPMLQWGGGVRGGNPGVVLQAVIGVIPAGGILQAGMLFTPDVPLCFGDSTGNDPALKLDQGTQAGGNLSLLKAARGFAGVGGLIMGAGMKAFWGSSGKPGLQMSAVTTDDLTNGVALSDSATPGVSVNTDFNAVGKLNVTGDTTVGNLTITGTQTGGNAGGATGTNFTGTTAAAYVALFDHVKTNGFLGSVSLKNTGLTNTLTWQIFAKDCLGNSGTSAGANLSPGASTNWDLQTGSTLALSGVLPPLQEFQLSVKDSVSGNHTAYSCFAVLSP